MPFVSSQDTGSHYPGYSKISYQRLSCKRGSGAALFVKRNLKFATADVTDVKFESAVIETSYITAKLTQLGNLQTAKYWFSLI